MFNVVIPNIISEICRGFPRYFKRSQAIGLAVEEHGVRSVWL